MSWKVVPAEPPDLKCVAHKKRLWRKISNESNIQNCFCTLPCQQIVFILEGGASSLDKLDFSLSKWMGNPSGAFRIFLFDKLKVLLLLLNCWNLYSAINLPRLNSHTHPRWWVCMGSATHPTTHTRTHVQCIVCV